MQNYWLKFLRLLLLATVESRKVKTIGSFLPRVVTFCSGFWGQNANFEGDVSPPLVFQISGGQILSPIFEAAGAERALS